MRHRPAAWSARRPASRGGASGRAASRNGSKRGTQIGVRRAGLRLLPGGLLLGAASAFVLAPGLREWVRPAVPVAAYVVTAAGILLGLRFGDVRAVFSLVVLALAEQAVHLAPPRGAPAPAGAAAALLVPLNLAALAWTPDRRARWSQVKLWAPLIAAQALDVALLLRPEAAEAARAFWHTVLEPVRHQWPTAGRLAPPVTVAALALALVRFALRSRPTEAGIVWALAAAFLALDTGGGRLVATLYLATGGVILVVALVEASYAMAYSDELTGLPARRALNDLLGAIGPPYAVAMVDIDHFKRFNDTYGHQAGDQLIRKVAAVLADAPRGGRPFRYGGEEFAVVFPGLSAGEAALHLEALRKAIGAVSFAVRGPDRRGRGRSRPRPDASARGHVGVTVSIGVADSAGAGATPADVVRAADDALYRAKRAGRNRLAT
jgi:GGDEF domain-containing protein